MKVLRQQVDQGVEDLDQGRSHPFDEDLLHRIKSLARSRQAAVDDITGANIGGADGPSSAQ